MPIPYNDLIRAPQSVIAYHGCHRASAQRILQGEVFQPSKKGYDWLGEGIYFWEYSPHRALEWAERKFGDEAAVLQAEIRLGHCLNLLDIAYYEGLQQVYDVVVEKYNQTGRKLPVNRADKRHYLDKAIIDEFCEIWVQNGGKPYQTVRGCFPEGEPVFEGSKILRETHVQISVRDVSCISGVELVQWP